MEERVNEVGRVAVVGELGAREVADGLADGAGDDDAGNQDEGVGSCGDQERQHIIPVEDVADDNVQSSNAGLLSMLIGVRQSERV